MMAGLSGVLSNLKIVKTVDLSARGGSASLAGAVLFFNLAGVPPLFGFLMKVVLLQRLVRLRVGVAIAAVAASMVVLMSYVGVFITSYCLSTKSGGANSGASPRAAAFICVSALRLAGLFTGVVVF